MTDPLALGKDSEREPTHMVCIMQIQLQRQRLGRCKLSKASVFARSDEPPFPEHSSCLWGPVASCLLSRPPGLSCRASGFLLLPFLPLTCTLPLTSRAVVVFCLFVLHQPQTVPFFKKSWLGLQDHGSLWRLKRIQPCPFMSLKSPCTCENFPCANMSEQVFLGFKTVLLGQKEVESMYFKI